MQPKTFIFYGISGSGKGTQAELLQSYLKEKDHEPKTLYFSTGKQFRQFAEGDSHTSTRVKEVLDNGGLLPAFLPIWTWTDWLILHFDGTQNIIFDGLARRAPEAPVFAGALSFYGFKNPYVILLNISREVATQRLKKRGRADDTDEEIKRRLDWFESEVMQAVDYFRNAPGFRFLDINGEQTVENIHKDIIKHIEKL